MINTDPYAAKQVGEEINILKTFQPLITPQATANFLQGKTDWVSYSPTLLEIIQELETKMSIVYTIHVIAASKLLGLAGPGLERLVYNSQRFWDAERTLTQFETPLVAIREEGFCLLSTDQAETLVQNKTVVEVYLTPRQRIGARLTKTTPDDYHWLMPRYRIRGYVASIETQYVKVPVVDKQ